MRKANDKAMARSYAIRVGLIVLASAVDALLTLIHIRLGVAGEANPAMAALLVAGGAGAFVLVKMSLTAFACLYLWTTRDVLFSRVASHGLVLVYVALLLWHLHLVGVWGVR